jgi:predicted DNA-binding transcriptional regulator YafY
MRTFRLDRIQAAAGTNRRFTMPEDFSARAYIESTMNFESNTTVVVHLNARVAPFVREHSGHWLDLTDCEDGSIIVRMEVSDLDWATGWVLSYGGAATALEPPELVARVRAEAEAIVDRYREA